MRPGQYVAASGRRLLSSLARNTAIPASVETLTSDANGADGVLHPDTVRTYLEALDRLMVTDDVPAWRPALAALNAGPARLLRELNWMGLLFESLVVRDLRVYASALGGEVLHYRDNTGLKADAIVELADGRRAGFEIKLGSSASVVDAAAASLLRLRDRVAGEEPVALCVITGTGYALTRRDGVLQIPIGSLSA